MSFESITIDVEPEKINKSRIDVKKVGDSETTLKNIYGNYMWTSLKPNQEIIFDYGTHPVFDGFVSAYRDHRPITISPDIIWLLIVQAFSNHVSNDPEALRSKFVNFDGKKELVVTKNIDINDMKPEDWENNFFPLFVDQISSYTGKFITDTLSPSFTTTTPTSMAVGNITIMSTMKHYFKYTSFVIGCGLPSVTIEGSIEDWEKIILKLKNLENYNFEDFTYEVIPIIENIIQTIKGRINLKFWKRMIRIKDSSGYYDPGHVDGWFTSFFPFDSDGDYIGGSISMKTKLQNETQKVPMKLVIVGQGSTKTIDCHILAGFVGITQNESTGSIKPEIGWFIREE